MSRLLIFGTVVIGLVKLVIDWDYHRKTS